MAGKQTADVVFCMAASSSMKPPCCIVLWCGFCDFTKHKKVF
jgi:hypothetical protein